MTYRPYLRRLESLTVCRFLHHVFFVVYVLFLSSFGYKKVIFDKGVRAKALGGCEGTEKCAVRTLHSQDVELM